MNCYKVLSKQVFSTGNYSIVPIRFEDRYLIMQWRNEQIYHLRQSKPLTKKDQDQYFENVVAKLFDQEKPVQILFSFLKDDQCIGYGGLVHINWLDQNAEISFVMDTTLEKKHFETHWICFLSLIKRTAFRELNLRKIYTYAFDLRPKLYLALDKVEFFEDARLKQHCFINGEFLDVLIHAYFSPLCCLKADFATIGDVELVYNWANEPEVRANALNLESILYEDHEVWYNSKLKSSGTNILIFRSLKRPLGQVRLDLVDGFWEIDYSVDSKFRGLGL